MSNQTASPRQSAGLASCPGFPLLRSLSTRTVPVLAFLVGSVQADITTSTSAPEADVISTTSLGTIDSGIFPLTGTAPTPIPGNDNHARGQLFTLGDDTGSGFEITAVTLQKNQQHEFFNDSMTLFLFEGTSDDWTAGTGHEASDASYFNDTTVTPLHEETFTIDGQVGNGEFVTLTLSTPLTVGENTDLGFLVTYSPATGGSPDRFRYREGNNGGRLSVSTSAHAVSTRSMNYFIQGSPVEAGLVSTSTTAPAEGIIDFSASGATQTSLFDEEANDNHARGQVFTLPNGPGSDYLVTGITIKKSATQTFSGDSLTLHLYEGSEEQWTSGTGHSTDTDEDNYYAGTTVTPLHSESFTLDGTITGGDYVTFTFGTPIAVSEDSDFGFFMTYDQSEESSESAFVHFENSAGGGRTSISSASHTISGSRRLVYYIHGSAEGDGDPLELGSPFQDRMVLQRDKPVAVWGTSTPGLTVSVTLDGTTVDGLVDASGNWQVELPAFTAGGPYTLSVSNGSSTLSVEDVLVGDVWLCFGQSNMVYTLGQMDDWFTSYRDDIIANDEIRCLKITQDASLTEEETASMEWLDNSTAQSWTAVGSVFAHQLHAATDVPTAIIWAAWGSSSIEGWLPLEMTEKLPHFEEMLVLYQSVPEFNSGATTSTRLPSQYATNEQGIAGLTADGWSSNSDDIFIRTRPNIIYNKMIHPMRKYGISGFVWYQGEANAGTAANTAQYGFTLPLFVEEYRERFGQGDLPFLGVQLPSYNSTYWPWFREAQASLESLNNGHVAVTIDTGLSGNIHPGDKEPIGERLALLARKYALGEDIEADSPKYESMSIDGNQVTIDFSHTDRLLTNDRQAPAGFEIAGQDQVFHDATSATISGSTVILSSNSVPNPVAVRYGWLPYAKGTVNLYGGNLLPVAPFRTDDWAIDGLEELAPVGVNDSYSVPAGGTLAVPASGVLANDIDLNKSVLFANLVADVSHGTLDLQSDGSFTYTPDAGFAGSDSFTYFCSERTTALVSGTTTVNLTIEGSLSGYFSWQSGIAWLAEGDEEAAADPDGDGIENFLEYALGLDPLVASTSGLPVLTPLEDGASFDFSNNRPGVLYEVLLSTDLEDWSQPAFASLTSESTTPVVIPGTEENEGKLFVRLRVSE